MGKLLACLALLAASVSGDSVADRRSDLTALADALRAHHPELRCGPDRESFDQRVTQLANELPDLSRDAFIVGMARVIAPLHDGHTQLGLSWDDAIGFRRYPISLYVFADGIHVRATTPALRDLAGARVVSIEGMPIDHVVERMRPIIHGDNESTFIDVLPSRLVLAEVLKAVGVAKSSEQAEFAFAVQDGRIVSRRLTPLPRSVTFDAIDARDASQPLPLYRQHPEKPYWFEYVESSHMMYVQFNSVENDPTEPFVDFVRRVFAEVERRRIDRFVLDIRNNNGGDNTLNQPLVHAVIRSDKVNKKGVLFTIIGRLTFSAAMNLAVDLERNTQTTFVGEPTGAAPNHFGETARMRLPSSGITLLYSTLFWQSSDPRDERRSIEPAIMTPLRFSDYREGRDPALAAILGISQN